jgi:hypothetical protein
VTSRFLVELRVGPRTLETAKELVASVAMAAKGNDPLLLVDDHLPYPSAILQVFGRICHGRRRRGRGRRKHPRLKAPPGLWVGVVRKVRDACGNLLRVRTRTLFGPRRQIRRRIAKLGIGTDINTAHLERCNGTMRGQLARLARRTRNGSRSEARLQHALWLWRDLHHWTRVHGSLAGRTPAMAIGLANQVWCVQQYVAYPVHVADLQRAIWAEERQNLLTSPLNAKRSPETLPML